MEAVYRDFIPDETSLREMGKSDAEIKHIMATVGSHSNPNKNNPDFVVDDAVRAEKLNTWYNLLLRWRKHLEEVKAAKTVEEIDRIKPMQEITIDEVLEKSYISSKAELERVLQIKDIPGFLDEAFPSVTRKITAKKITKAKAPKKVKAKAATK